MSNRSRIPTAEEFARARALMEERDRGLDEVRDAVLERFRGRYPLHEFHILTDIQADFRAYVFYDTDEDIHTCRRNGITDEISEHVYGLLERVGRGGRNAIRVAFEIDSDENVRKRYGNYFNRLR